MRTRERSLQGHCRSGLGFLTPTVTPQEISSQIFPVFTPFSLLGLLWVHPPCGPCSLQLLLLPPKPFEPSWGSKAPSYHPQGAGHEGCHTPKWPKLGGQSTAPETRSWGAVDQELAASIAGFYCCQCLGRYKGLPCAGLEGDVPFGAFPTLVGGDLGQEDRGLLLRVDHEALHLCFLQSSPFPREILQEFSISAGEERLTSLETCVLYFYFCCWFLF